MKEFVSQKSANPLRRSAIRQRLDLSRFAGWRGGGAPVLALGLGALLTLGWFFVIRGWERESLRNATQNVALERVELLRGRLLGSLETLDSVAALYGVGRQDLTRAEFRAFVDDALARHPEIQALSWNPLVSDAQRPEYEAAARRDGLTDFSFRELNARGELSPAQPRAAYVPVYFEEPGAGNERSFGFDLFSSPERKATLERARDTGAPAATVPLRLVQERGDQLGFLILRPVYHGPAATLAERQQNLAGFASAVFRIRDLVEMALGKMDAQGMGLSIYDDASGSTLIRSGSGVYESKNPAVSADSTQSQAGFSPWVQTLDFPGGRWRLVFQPTPRFVAAHTRSRQLWAGFGAGFLVTLLATGYLWRGKRRTAEIERRVLARTAELSAEVTERKRMEIALREAETKYRSIFENSIEGIFQTTADGHYLSANPALARLYGYETPAALIADLADIERRLYVEPGRRAEFIRLVQESGSVSDFESQIRRTDGQIIWVSEKARAVRGAQGELLYYEGVVADVTERKLADETLRTSHDALETRVAERTAELARTNAALRAEIVERQRAESAAAAASAAKSDFLAHMSHEIRTPLNAILGYAQILRRDAALPAAQRPAVETIAMSGNHLLELIDDVLDLSKIEAGHMELRSSHFNLRALVGRLETMFAQQCRSKGLALSVQTSRRLPELVQGDEGKLRQSLINLLGNAVKFTESGSICLQVSILQEDDKKEQRGYFEVQDTGPGISSEHLATIFEPFQQADSGGRKGGTGLGLTISRRQIELMGGRLGVESVPGAGARFFFDIPLASVESLAAAALFSEVPDSLRLKSDAPVRALVVDDVPANRDVLAAALTSLGCQVTTAPDGPAALQCARAALPDIVFMDIWLPDGPDGIETARLLRAEHGTGVQIVAHSASALDCDRRHCLDAGFNDFFVKPFRVERVYECLTRLLPVEPALTPLPLVRAEEDMSLLPADLLARLRGAAALYSLTELRACLEEMNHCAAGRHLAQRLQRWLDACDLDAIRRHLDDLPMASENADILAGQLAEALR